MWAGPSLYLDGFTFNRIGRVKPLVTAQKHIDEFWSLYMDRTIQLLAKDFIETGVHLKISFLLR